MNTTDPPEQTGNRTPTRYGLVVPTYNAGDHARHFLDGVSTQTLHVHRKLAIDSSSRDGTANLFRDQGFEVISIPTSQFDHGGTRQQGVEALEDVDVIVFATQDIQFSNQVSLANLVSVFDEFDDVAASYGRQLPHLDADVFAAHARNFNYPPKSEIRGIGDAKRLGVKAAFISNSFSAYRRTDLCNIGGFPSPSLFGEDFCVALKFLHNNLRIAYQADACVRHSHNYSIAQEFSRYFDIGVLYAQQQQSLAKIGKPDGEGMRYLRSELAIAKAHGWMTPIHSLMRCGAKFTGYKIGRHYSVIPRSVCQRLSMYPPYWKTT
ncbi:glycosyltransferase [Stieleria sp. TO1_6]|uniref:glycosyltransferase family 2 protein n=1 Tax=Stieleria tagensis TaxID=2956795 RepID=UPI00209B045A|nr:glycosyltransferase [Stieleria tagensis]MCO8121620.1 glycosyltransferase [Stieleria tagensis]